MRDDEQLVADALEGSDDAFGALVDRYQGRLLRFLKTRCRSHADAEDALQDTFINAYRYLASYDSRWRFSTWLYRIAIREALRQVAAPMPGPDSGAEETVDPLTACIVACERENLWLTAKQRLSPEMYTALWLHYADEMPLRQIGQVMERSLPWVKVTLYRGRRRLQETLAASDKAKSQREAYG